MKHITIYTDGGARNNPGPAGAGVVIVGDDGKVIEETSRFLGVQTNNWAEYEAVILGLHTAKDLGFAEEKILFKLDSQLVVEQLNGNYRIKMPTLRDQYNRIQEMLKDMPHVTFTHIPRAENAEADRLANEAMDRGE
ncbi:MAG: ribonuclease HI family protein [Candidatus Pacebacteria bacterium]|nr:ribonuclease HI family protein [Candidatus Paceibacterota bacterium]